jgi:hypothetical protein
MENLLVVLGFGGVEINGNGVTSPPQKNNPKKKKNPFYNLHQIFILKKPRCKKIHQCEILN